MIFSGASEYALRALTHLAHRRDREFVPLNEIAEAEDIPYPFLAKIAQRLVRTGLLESAKGRTGGFALARPATEITLYDIKEAIDGTDDLERCASGLARCSDEMPCPLHDTFKPIRERIKAYLRATTLQKMALAVQRKRALLEAERTTSGAAPAGRRR